MSINQFKNVLKNYIEKWCDKNGQDFSNSKSRGNAFEDFIFELLVKRYDIEDASEDENIFRTNEKGIDIIIPPSDNSPYFIVCQCEHGGFGTKTKDTIDKDKMTGFFNRFGDITLPDWIENREELQLDYRNKLIDLRIHIDRHLPVKWLYASNKRIGNSSSELDDIIRKYNYKTLYPSVEFEILDIDELTALFMETEKIQMEYPDKVEFNHGANKGIYDNSGHKFFVGLIKANVIVDWYKTHKESLFEQNIRTLLTKNRINTDMALTITNAPGDFRHFNNGVSAICEKLEYDEELRRVSAKKFNIINGAQTVGTLFEQRNSGKIEEVEVLLRITAVKYSDKLSNDITKYNNTQNAVSSADFKSNDEIQIWLEKKFNDYDYPKYFRKIVYRRKRPYARGSKSEYALSILEFAKIRRVILQSSATQNSNPNLVWKSKEDGGCYEEIFPNSGILDNKEFEKFNFMFNVYKEIERKINEERENNKERTSLKRMVALGLEAFNKFWIDNKEDFDNYAEIEKGNADAKKVLKIFWAHFYRALGKIYDNEIIDGSTTAYAFVRSDNLTKRVVSSTNESYQLQKELNEIQ